MMTKQIKIVLDNIQKAKDINFVNSTVDSIITSLHDFPNDVSKMSFDRDKNMSFVKFTLRVSKTGDMVFILIKEWLNLCLETEPNLFISISEIEEKAKTGTTYRFFTYVPN